MRRRSLIAIAVIVPSVPAWAQPTGCPPARPQPGIPLQLDLNSLPGGATRGVQGTAEVVVPAGPPPPCATSPHLPQDVLHGDPGDALRGEPPPR
jgi:hypothetical protein